MLINLMPSRGTLVKSICHTQLWASIHKGKRHGIFKQYIGGLNGICVLARKSIAMPTLYSVNGGVMKICQCETESTAYFDMDGYSCQYCSGLLSDINRVEKIIGYNTPVGIKNRTEIIAKELSKHIKKLNSVA